MKTNEQILERYLSPDSVDIFNAQRISLLCMLPYLMAKPYLEASYVTAYEDGSLPEEERWIEGVDINKQILDFLPDAYKALEVTNEMECLEGLLYLKSWIWAVDEEFHGVIEPLFEEDLLDKGKSILDAISTHFGYSPTIQDIDFEEIPKEEEC